MKIEQILKSKRIILYGNKEICEQIKYVLNKKNIKIVTELKNLKKTKNTIIILCYISKKEKKFIKQHFKYRKDYINISNLYKILNKGYFRKFEISTKNLANICHIIRPKFTNMFFINQIPEKYLRTSEMLLKALNSPKKSIDCNNLERMCNIDSNGQIWGCCATWVKIPFSNLLKNKETDLYDNYAARIIKLSSLNKTYCFCNFNKCKYNHQKTTENKELNTKKYPDEITISIDETCNLKCTSCRKHYYKASKKEKFKQNLIVEKLKKTGWLDKSIITMAGQGEVFYSNIYKDILKSDIKRDTIKLLTNGTLFNKKNWDFISSIYKNIYISISIDAATKETYQKLRCGNFEYLKKNLEMLGKLRKENKIKEIQYNFVVQKDNYKEIPEFIKMAMEYNVDMIQFTKLNNWGTFTNKEYIEKSMLIEGKYLQYELYKMFQDPIFRSKKIDLIAFEEYINNSKDIYKDRDE